MYNKKEDLNFEEVKAYYEKHSKVETCEHFNITARTFAKLLKENNYKKPQSLIKALMKQTIAQDPELWNKRQEKTNKTKINKYGSLDKAYHESWLKGKQTKKTLYGNENYNNRDKYKETCLEKFGCENPFQNEQIKTLCNTKETIEKANKSRAKTFKTKYNVEFVGQLPQSHENYLYNYDNTYFDSSWELALWIYAKDHNEEIIRLPQTIYFDYNNTKHSYSPDFLYKGALIEIKGGQFLKGTELYNPYHDNTEIDKIKTKLIKEYDIQIWSQTKIKPFLDYIKTTYGKDYLKQFKVKGD